MDEGEAVLGRESRRFAMRFAQPGAAQHHVGAMRRRALDLGEGSALGHDDGRRNAETPGMIGDALRVVAGRHGDDAGAALLRRQALQLVERAALLERAGRMQRFQLEDDLRAD